MLRVDFNMERNSKKLKNPTKTNKNEFTEKTKICVYYFFCLEKYFRKTKTVEEKKIENYT